MELKRYRYRKFLLLLTLLIVVAAAFGSGYYWRNAVPLESLYVEERVGVGTSQAGGTQTTVTPPATGKAMNDARELQNVFAAVAQAVNPAVVTITTWRDLRAPEQDRPRHPFGEPFDPFSRENPFEEFFRHFQRFGFNLNSFGANDDNLSGLSSNVQDQEGEGAAVWQVAQTGARRKSGLGSGFIYRSDGLIVTNAHVVKDADEVVVKLADGRTFRDARVLGTDERTDMAVIKINASQLPAVRLGDSSQVQVGDWAIAVGNPFGLEHTLTVGVISAKAREVPLHTFSAGDYLQTDASINPGNSGGPLLDIQGRVIGVNNAIYSESGGNIGIGFAIPINTARQIADLLIKEGRVRRAYLGVGISNVEEHAAAFGLNPNIKGVLIERVEPNSPGAFARLQPGDVVVAFNGQAVTRSGELQRLVSSAPIGSEARLTIMRNGQTLMVTTRLTELKEDQANPLRWKESQPDGRPRALGLLLSPATPEVMARLGLREANGVVVLAVEINSPAALAGLQPGDIIERVAQTPVATPEAMQKAIKMILEAQRGNHKTVALYVNRHGDRRFVIVELNQ